MTQLTNSDFLHLDLKIGNIISFTNSVNHFQEYTITRIEKKSIYLDGNRNSWGTFKKLSLYTDFKIIE